MSKKVAKEREKVLKNVIRVLREVLPESKELHGGNIIMGGWGLVVDLVGYDQTSFPCIEGMFRTSSAFSIYKLRTYIDYIIGIIGQYMTIEIAVYEEDKLPNRRGCGRESFLYVDVFIYIE